MRAFKGYSHENMGQSSPCQIGSRIAYTDEPSLGVGSAERRLRIHYRPQVGDSPELLELGHRLLLLRSPRLEVVRAIVWSSRARLTVLAIIAVRRQCGQLRALPAGIVRARRVVAIGARWGLAMR